MASKLATLRVIVVDAGGNPVSPPSGKTLQVGSGVVTITPGAPVQVIVPAMWRDDATGVVSPLGAGEFLVITWQSPVPTGLHADYTWGSNSFAVYADAGCPAGEWVLSVEAR